LVKGVILALLAVLLAAAPALAVPTKLPPIETCGTDPGFVKFRAALKRTVANKDRASFLKMLSPKVLVNFGGASGPEAFAEQWDFDPGTHGIWNLLETMLKMGCARSDRARIIPSLIVQMEPYADEDMIDAVVILPGAKLYKETGVESLNPSTVPWTIAPVTSRAGDLVTGVRLPDGREGFISDDDLYEPLGYRMVIEKLGGRWKITAFVAGD
jgi:hypothetical protein